MAITISGENNNDKILASDGVIDQISGFSLVGVVTATSFTGDLTGDVTGNLLGNVTGNINNSTLLLQTGGTERLRITSDGKIGIGNNNPARILDVNGTTRFSNGASIEWGGTSASIAGESSSNTLFFRTASEERLRIDSVGMTGVRTLSPRATLHVKAHDNNWEGGLLLENNSNSNGWNLHPENSNNSLMIGYNDDVTASLTSQSATTAVQVYSDGDVDINGNLEVHELLAINSGNITQVSTSSGAIGPTLKLFHNSASPAANDVVSRISMVGDDAAGNETIYSRIETVIDDPTNGQETAHIQFATRGYSSFNPILRLKNRGTASAPNYTTDDINGIILDVYNTGNPYPRYMNFIAKSGGNTDSNMGFWTEAVGGSPTEKLRINKSAHPNGLVEIKNFSGLGLHLQGGADASLKISDTDGTNQHVVLANNGGESYIVTRNNTSHGSFKLYSQNGSETLTRLRIDSNGDINLGNNPTNQYGYRLNIEDSSQILYAQTASSGGTELKLFLDHGNTIANFGTVTSTHLALVTSNTEKLRIKSDGNIETKGLGTFEFNDGWSAEGRNIVVFPYDDSSNWFSFIGTNLRFTNGGNFVKPSDQANQNWGNIAGIAFEGSNNGSDPAIRFVVDQPGENGLNYSLGSGSSGKTAAIDNKTVMSINGNGVITNSTTHPQIILKDPAGRQASLRAPSSTNFAALGTDTGHDLIFYTNGYSNERLRIASDGVIHVASPDLASGGRIWGNSSALYLQSGNGRQTFKVSDAAAGVNRTIEMTSAGHIKFPAGYGIEFSGGTPNSGSNPTINSAVLDDYEEGKFDPKFLENGTTESNYSWRYGSYVKVGGIVTVRLAFGLNGFQGNFTTGWIGGMPYTHASPWGTSDFSYIELHGYSYASGYGDSDSKVGLFLELSQNADKFRVVHSSTKGNVNQSSIGTGQRIAVTFQYPVA